MENSLRLWRESRQFSVTQAAESVGVTPAMWSRWENERRRIPAERVAELASKTGIERHNLRPDLYEPAEAAE